MAEYLEIFAVVLGVNLLPALGPPTWSILVLYRVHSSIPVIPLVVIGALAAAIGRYLLAHAFRLLGRFLSDRTKRRLAAARAALEGRRRNAILGVALFALSPVPSAQLFEAAGLARVRLLGFTTWFFIGRLVSYSIYVLITTKIQESSIGDEFQRAITSPLGVSVQILMIALLVVFTRIDWEKRLGAHAQHSPQNE